jgi:predicted amidophosphoribosyltransferase
MNAVAFFIDSDVPLLVALAIAALVVILASSSSANRKRQIVHDQRPHACPGCGTVHPGYANYCRRCGARLS